MRPINKIQILIGVIGLSFGSLVYLVDRPPHQTYFVCSSRIDISLFSTIPNLFGNIGYNLPAFLHVFSFILITAGILSWQKKGLIIICLSWFSVDFAFELFQKFNTWPLKIVPDWFERIPFLENTAHHFRQGTFDGLDLAAIAFGTAIGYWVLLVTNKAERRVVS